MQGNLLSIQITFLYRESKIKLLCTNPQEASLHYEAAVYYESNVYVDLVTLLH